MDSLLAKRFGGAYAQELQRRATRKEEITMMQKVAIMALVLGLIGAGAFAQGTGQPSGAVQGQVFITDADGGRSVVAATKITLDGPTHLEALSDNEGRFAISAVPTGSYTIAAKTPGMTATQGVVVTARTSVTATTDSVDTKTEPSGTNTIAESAVHNMPNADEHFQSLLPLVPGVVRGPNGQINMKGARASQNGSRVK